MFKQVAAQRGSSVCGARAAEMHQDMMFGLHFPTASSFETLQGLTQPPFNNTANQAHFDDFQGD
jgi:hypothetical protein